MSKTELITALKRQKIVAVIRGTTAKEGIKTAESCLKGGVGAVEITYTNQYADNIISELTHKYPKALVGAGTVLDAVTARGAILAGAQFIVSPAFNRETALLCNRYNIIYIPGCMTITEVVTALEYGSEMVKLFPGSVLGPSFVAALKAPIPHVSVMVTGGVNLNNLAQWFAAGADALGIGGEFNQLAQEGKFVEIEERARKYQDAVKQRR